MEIRIAFGPKFLTIKGVKRIYSTFTHTHICLCEEYEIEGGTLKVQSFKNGNTQIILKTNSFVLESVQ